MRSIEVYGGLLNRCVPNSKSDAEASVDVAAFERCPRVHGPAAVDRARREKQRIPSRLPDTREFSPFTKRRMRPNCFSASNPRIM